MLSLVITKSGNFARSADEIFFAQGITEQSITCYRCLGYKSYAVGLCINLNHFEVDPCVLPQPFMSEPLYNLKSAISNSTAYDFQD